MGDAAKKLRDWCEFEFGGIKGAPGNCTSCLDHYQSLENVKYSAEKTRAEKLALDQLDDSLLKVLPIEPKKVSTPCGTCPKFLLTKWAGGQKGLLPENELCVTLYYYCRQEKRIGVFDSAPLERTIDLTSTIGVLQVFSDHYPTDMGFQNMLTKVLLIDQIATRIQQAKEERQREIRAKAPPSKD